MGNQLLEKHFARLGARVRFGEVPRERTWRTPEPGIDIATDRKGDLFDIRVETGDDISYEVVDLRRDLRHLLLMARREDRKEKFLCGHDERHWFVCAVPGRSVSSVTDAMEALQPKFVHKRVITVLKRAKNRFTRRNEAFVRQGEWFFIPFPDLVRPAELANSIYKNEPLSRGFGSKSHICEEIFRTGGEAVMFSHEYQSGVTISEYRKIITENPTARKWRWRTFHKGMTVYVRGTVRHPDHKTIHLDGWHQVLMNTENQAPGRHHVVFLD
jgi:hypothetical protein